MKINDFDTSTALFEARAPYRGAPGYGQRSHGGFGQKIFTKAHWSSIAAMINELPDRHAAEYLGHWFGSIFQKDNSSFDEAKFVAAIKEKKFMSRVQAKFQSRHFYFLAHEITEIPDGEIRTFLAEWLADYFDKNNVHFLRDRWFKYCNLPEDHYERQRVAAARAKVDNGTPAA